jgi:hypothetical protein
MWRRVTVWRRTARRRESPRNDRQAQFLERKKKEKDDTEKNAARNVGKGDNNGFMFVHWREPLRGCILLQGLEKLLRGCQKKWLGFSLFSLV